VTFVMLSHSVLAFAGPSPTIVVNVSLSRNGGPEGRWRMAKQAVWCFSYSS